MVKRSDINEKLKKFVGVKNLAVHFFPVCRQAGLQSFSITGRNNRILQPESYGGISRVGRDESDESIQEEKNLKGKIQHIECEMQVLEDKYLLRRLNRVPRFKTVTPYSVI